MDWSLVLISQGIPSTILDPGESESWALEVAQEDLPRALQALKQYRLENRQWAWQSRFPVQGYLFDWGALAWVFLVLVFYWASSERSVFRAGGMMEVGAVANGQWWRLFTAIWLHGDVAHLAGNASLGMVLLGLTMGLYGTGTGLLGAYLAGVGGNLLVLVLTSGPRASLGASGLVMGCVGLMAAQPFAWAPKRQQFRLLLVGVGGGLMLFVLLGLGEGTDVLAHFGGFITGLLLGWISAGLRLNPANSTVNVASGVIFVILTLVPWILALR